MIILRYLNREILLTTAAISFCLFLLFFGHRFTQYLDQAASGDLAPGVILRILAYRIPDVMVLIISVAYFLGILIAYGRLYSDNEMVVLSGGGVSQARLLAYTLVSAVLMAALVGFLSLYVSPYSVNKVEEIKVESSQRSYFELLHAGRFEQISEDDPLIYYFENFSGDNKVIEQVLIADVTSGSDRKGAATLITAQSAREVVDSPSGNRYLVLGEGRQYVGQPGQLDFQITRFSSSGQLLETRAADDAYRNYFERLSTRELWNKKGPKFQAELQWRLSFPLLVVILAMIAVPTSYTDPRRGRYAKIFPAFIPVLFYMAMLLVAKDYVQDGKVPAALGLWWVHGVFFTLAIFLLAWNNGRPLGQWRNHKANKTRDKAENLAANNNPGKDSEQSICAD